MTTLKDALTQIAESGSLNAEELIAYAAEDQVGGRDTGQWSDMSTFAAEGQVLYALIRALRPAQVVEIGVASGGTSTHILSALEANGHGLLYSVDVEASCGLDIPEHLRHRWTFVVGDGLTAKLPEHADFCFEDGSHAYEFTRDMLMRLKTLGPRIIVAHDYYTHETYGGFFVKQAFDEVLPGGTGIKLDDAFTGLGYWWNDDPAQPEAEKKAPTKRKATKHA